MLNEVDHHRAGRDQHRIGSLNLPLHLDDGGPERVAGARDWSDEARSGELLEIAVGGLGRYAEMLGGRLDGPLWTLDREQSERLQEAVATASRYALDRSAHSSLVPWQARNGQDNKPEDGLAVQPNFKNSRI